MVSPACGSSLLKSMVRPLSRQGVPVLKRASWKLNLGANGQSLAHQLAPSSQALARMEHPNIARIFDAGTGAGNVVPGSFVIDFNFRFSTASTVEGLQSRVHQLLDRHGLEYGIAWTLGARPFLTPRGELSAARRRNGAGRRRRL